MISKSYRFKINCIICWSAYCNSFKDGTSGECVSRNLHVRRDMNTLSIMIQIVDNMIQIDELLKKSLINF